MENSSSTLVPSAPGAAPQDFRHPPPARLSPRHAGVSSDMTSYREGYKNLVRIIFLQAFVALFLTGVICYHVTYVLPQDSYYAISALTNGAELKRQMTGLENPNMSREAVLRWAAASATEIMTFGFDDIDERLGHARRLFTNDGWESFQTALRRTGLPKSMIENQQLLSAIPASTPTMVMEGMLQGAYTWVVDVRSILTLRAADKKTNANLSVRLIIVKMPTKENPMGIGIQTWIAY